MMINEIEIRKLTMTDISCDLLLYGSAELGISISKKVFGAIHRFIEEPSRLLFECFTSETYCLLGGNFCIVKYPILDCVVHHHAACVVMSWVMVHVLWNILLERALPRCIPRPNSFRLNKICLNQ